MNRIFRIFYAFLVLLSPLAALSQVYILDEQFTSAPTLPPAWSGLGGPFTASSGTSNFGRNAPSFGFNTTGQRIQYGPWVGSPDHLSFYYKGTSGNPHTILVEESTNGVAWTTAGTATSITTAATFDCDLLATSKYIRLTFTQSGTGNTYIDDLRIRTKTNNCTTPLKILQLLINGGCGACEGSNEFVYFDTGSQPLDIRYFELVSQTVPVGGNSYGGNGGFDNANTNWVTYGNYTAAQLTYILNLNTTYQASVCPGVFVPVPSTNVIPANARVIAITGASPDAPYNFSQLCSLGTVYVIFADQADCGGKYANSSCSSNCTRCITLFNHQYGCIDNEYYLANSSSTSTGNGYIFSGSNVGYTSTATCAMLVLSLKILNEKATQLGASVAIDWDSNDESNTVYYLIQRSGDTRHWNDIGTVYAQHSDAHYQFTDYNPSPLEKYYRIKGISENGEVQFTSGVMVLGAFLSQPIITNEYIHLNADDSWGVDVYTATGKLVLQSSGMNAKSISIESFPTGVYLLVYRHAGQSSSYRFVKIK